MHTQVNLHDIALLEDSVVLPQRRVMPTDLIDGEARGEGHSLVHGLLVVDLGAFGFDEPVGEDTRVNNLDAHFEAVQDLGEDDWVRELTYSLRFCRRLCTCR